jgi:hypothetical protein
MRSIRGKLALALVGALLVVGCIRSGDGATARSAAVARAQLAGTPEATVTEATATPSPVATATGAAPTATGAAPTATSGAEATAVPTATIAPTAAATATTSASIWPEINLNGAGGRNIVQVVNRNDARLRVEGKVDYGHANGPNVAPVNSATAYASCTGCQTLVLAAQIVVYGRDATTVSPKNTAIAVNVQCTGCVTVARAIQYALPVDDPKNPPDGVKQLVKELNAELNAMKTDQSLTLDQAIARMNAVMARFNAYSQNLMQQEDVQTAPTTGVLPPA